MWQQIWNQYRKISFGALYWNPLSNFSVDEMSRFIAAFTKIMVDQNCIKNVFNFWSQYNILKKTFFHKHLMLKNMNNLWQRYCGLQLYWTLFIITGNRWKGHFLNFGETFVRYIRFYHNKHPPILQDKQVLHWVI